MLCSFLLHIFEIVVLRSPLEFQSVFFCNHVYGEKKCFVQESIFTAGCVVVSFGRQRTCIKFTDIVYCAQSRDEQFKNFLSRWFLIGFDFMAKSENHIWAAPSSVVLDQCCASVSPILMKWCVFRFWAYF